MHQNCILTVNKSESASSTVSSKIPLEIVTVQISLQNIPVVSIQGYWQGISRLRQSINHCMKFNINHIHNDYSKNLNKGNMIFCNRPNEHLCIQIVVFT